MGKLVWLVPALPLLGVIVNGLWGRTRIKGNAHWIAVPAAGLSFLVALLVFLDAAAGGPLNWDVYTWVEVGTFQVPVGFQVDGLSAVMMLTVTLVGFLIHVYSIGYMHGDPGYPRFFTYLNLFMFSMLMLVLANNYLLLFLGWEGVGLCSYLLIGFWYEKKVAADAGKKAFIVNRVGDAGFLLGLFLMWGAFGSLKFSEVFARAHELLGGQPDSGLAIAITLLLFMGAVGKSAQLPLYVWLPDAMEGPTPVSALIHAATMVTAGVYMVARSAPLYDLAPFSLHLVAWVGAITAVFAATIALVQNDIKRIIAYSTISQLGYMFLAAGAAAYASAIFHLMTHAFFKALLFLGAGSVIHGMGGEQDIRRMGGLRKYMPVTAITFFLAALANAGVFPLAGFWSKDEIIFAAFQHGHYGPWLLGTAGAFLTGFYMFRLYFLAFEGQPRFEAHGGHHVHESPPAMAIPLQVLAFFTVVVGLVGFPPERGLFHAVLGIGEKGTETAHPPVSLEILMAVVSVSIALAGIGLAYRFYLSRPELPEKLAERFRALYRLLLNKYWVDELYGAIFVTFGQKVCGVFGWLDEHVVDGAVNGASWLTVRLSRVSDVADFRGVDGVVNGIADVIQIGSQTMRRAQTGAIQNYILAMAAGIAAMVFLYALFGGGA